MIQPNAGVLFPAILVGAMPSLAIAAVEDPLELDPIVVTATRLPETAEQTLASVSVIERAEIEERQSRTMADVLRGLPGVAISESGGAGQPTSVFLRGTESDHVLVLIDGVKIGSATLGTAPWQNIPIEQIDRIEVVRGPRSSLYGSEAIGGVVQIFTRGGEPGPLQGRVSAGIGTYHFVTSQLGLSGGTDHAWFDASMGFERTKGFNACNGEPLVGGCFVDQPDRDGYRNENLSIRAGYRPSDAFELSANLLRSTGDTDYDGSAYAGNHNKSLLQVAGLRLALRPTATWESLLSVARSWDDSSIDYDGEFLDRFDTQRDLLSWQNNLVLTQTQTQSQRLSLGADYQLDHISTEFDYARDARANLGVFGEYLAQFGRHDVHLSARQDDNQQFGGHATGNLGWGYAFANGVRFTAAWGSAFKAPTFNELYYPGFGNPDLKPETAWSGELGLSGPHQWGNWGVSLYQTRVDDLIAFDVTTYAPANLDSARIRGLELWAEAVMFEWQVDANLTLLDPRNTSAGADHGNLLARRPEQSLRLDADRRLGAFGVGATLTLAGARYDDFANTVRLDGFALVDLRAEYALSRALRIQGRVENLFNADYETAAYYNQPGRSVFVTLRYAP